MMAREVIKLRQFVPGHASALVAARHVFQEPDLLAPGLVDLFLGFWIDAHLPGEQYDRQITAVRRADAPRRRRGVSGEDVPGDVASYHRSGVVETARGQGLGSDARPGSRVVKAHRDPRDVVDLCLTGGPFHPYPDPDSARAWPQHPEENG
jgi:hypothetical protein